MGIELELSVLLVLAIAGPAFFSAFSLEIPAWQKALKWAVLCAATLALYRVGGHLALLLPAVTGVAGLSVHFWWCRRNGIHPLRAVPRRHYYALRGWEWPADT